MQSGIYRLTQRSSPEDNNIAGGRALAPQHSDGGTLAIGDLNPWFVSEIENAMY
ncbi:MAG: hypothetical protein R3C05_00725 [Pirellulaceae bacterium]